MAKKTARKQSAKKTAPPLKPKPSKKSPAPKAVTKPALSDESIGHAAGEVWSFLHGGGPVTLATLKKAIDRPSDQTLMAVGWLAREGKLDYVSKGRSIQVVLR